MSDQLAIAEGFRLLRERCDPRGHDLLRALENLCLCESIALDAVVKAVREPDEPSNNVVEMIDHYSRKVTP
jgi:hypothetical protein